MTAAVPKANADQASCHHFGLEPEATPTDIAAISLTITRFSHHGARGHRSTVQAPLCVNHIKGRKFVGPVVAVEKRYNGVVAVSDVSFEVAGG